MSALLTTLQSALASLRPSRKYLIGVSGGIDSIVLLHALHTLGYKKLIICHLNHGLRGRSSQADARFVERIAKQLDLPFEIERVDTQAYAKRNKKSLELAARELRYEFFNQCVRRHHCRKIFLAHQADDQIETCLFNLFRGSGLAGLCGMQTHSRTNALEIFRPLLVITRKEILEYAKQFDVQHREDKSNSSPLHTRNRIRHQVIPAIEQAFGPAFRKAILRTIEILRAEEMWLASAVPPPEKILSCKTIQSYPLAIQRRVIRQWLLNHGIPEPGFEETSRVLSLLDSQRGPAKINLPGNSHARRRAGKIFIER